MAHSATRKVLEPLVEETSAVEKTRKKVMDAAIAEFGEHGLAGARVDQISKKAGVNKQAIYYHYGDKETLFQKALLHGYEQMFRLPKVDWENDPRPTSELMRMVVEKCFEQAERNRSHISLIADVNRGKGRHLNQELLSAIHEAVAVTINTIRTLVRRGQKKGEFRENVNPDDLYLFIVGQPIFYFNHRHTLSAILQQDITARERVDQHKSQMVGLVMSSLEVSR